MYLDTDTRRLLANERIATLRGTPPHGPLPQRRRIRRRIGGWLIAVGTRLAPEARPAAAGRPRARRA